MMDVGQPWYNKSIISDVWFTLILLHLLLDPGTGISHNSFKQPTYLPSLFSFIHTCGVCLTSKQSPQHFMQQRVPTPLWGAHLQLMALTDSRSARSTTLPLPPDLAPGDDGGERRTFKSNNGPDKSAHIQRGFDEQNTKTTHTMKPTQNKYNIVWKYFSQTVRFNLAPKEPNIFLEYFFLCSQLIVWFSAMQEQKEQQHIRLEKCTFIQKYDFIHL